MNKVILMGRVTKEIELKGTNTLYCNFTLAVNRRSKEKETDFISCKAFGKTAESISKFVQKGQQIAIEGRIQIGSYEKDGNKVYVTDIIIDTFYFADSKKESPTPSTEVRYTEDVGNEELPF